MATSRFLHLPLLPTLALLAVYAVFYLQFAGALIAFPFDVDQGEGYDAWSGWLIDRGQVPYTRADTYPYYSHGYPPVWSYLVSIPMAWTGPGLAPARAVSTLAALLAAVVIGLAARRLARSSLAGILAAGFFLASPYVFHTTPLARVNGTMLLFSVLAVSAFERATNTRLLLGCLALLAAMFTKPTAFDAVVACLGFALLVRPRAGVFATVGLGAVGLATLLGLEWISGGTYLFNVLAGNAGEFTLWQLQMYLGNFLLLHGVLLLLAAVETGVRVRRRAWSPWVLYFVASLLLSVTVGKWGAGESYFLAPLAAGCVLGSAAIVRVLRSARGAFSANRTERIIRAWALGILLLGQSLLLAHGPLSEAVAWLPDRGFQSAVLGRLPTPGDVVAAQSISDWMREKDGPVLTEEASFAVEAGKEVIGATPPSVRSLHMAGLWSEKLLVADIVSHRYGMVVLNAQLYPEPVLEAIGRHYYLARDVQVNGVQYRVFLPGSE